MRSRWIRQVRLIAQYVKTKSWRLLSREGFWWVTVIIAVGVIGALISWGHWESLHGEEASPSNTIRNIGFIIGGGVALLFALWRSRLAERQATTGQQGLLNERYQKGAEMLGSGILSVRMGGIYALQSLAEERPNEYYIQIMGLFCAFVRHPTKDDFMDTLLDGEISENIPAKSVREDVQAIMEFIRRRKKSNIDLEQRRDFRIDLKEARLTGVRLWNAKLCETDLEGVNLHGAILTNADLSGAELRDADLSEVEAIEANFSRAILDGSDLRNSKLFDSDFSDAQMSEVNLSESELMDANLSSAGLAGSDLSQSLLMGVDMSNARIHGVDLSKAFFANPSPNDVVNGMYTTTDTIVTGLTQNQLDSAYAQPSMPPKLDGINDVETGEPLVWRGNHSRRNMAGVRNLINLRKTRTPWGH